MDGVEKVDGRRVSDHFVTRTDLDSALQPIARELHELDVNIQTHLVHSAIQDTRLEEISKVIPRLRELEDWRLETLTMIRLLKLTFGASIIAAAVGILNLIDLLRHSGGF